MRLIITITDNEELLYELLTGWIDIGITESTVLDSIDSLHVVSEHVPIFAGFKALTGGGIRRNKTIIAMVEDEETLKQAIHFLKKLFEGTSPNSRGIYYVVPVSSFGHL